MLKKTKIVATISDLKCEVRFLKELYKNGVNVFRLNTAHQSEEDTLKVVKNIRKVSNKIPIMIDTKGPEIRTTSTEEEIFVKKGDEILFRGDKKGETTSKCIYVNYDDFVKEVPKDFSILYDDGAIEFKVIDKKADYLKCVVQNEGQIKSRKTISVPNVSMKLPSLTEKDKSYVEFCAKHGIEFIAHSFIRNKEDLFEVQKILDKKKSPTKIIAKIENQEGVNNIDEIIDNCYGIMVARGDLGIELPAYKIPSIQKDIINKCIEKKKTVITATQMLHTMIENPRPTRAEVNDIANAIYDGTDAIMLSGETAFGKYPVEAVKVMNSVALEVEKHKSPFHKAAVKNTEDNIPAFLATSAINASLKIKTKAIIADTTKGRNARYLASFRGQNVIFAQCYDERVARELALSYGVYSSYTKTPQSIDAFIKGTLKRLLLKKRLEKEDAVVIIAGSFGPTHGASFIEVSKVKNLI